MIPGARTDLCVTTDAVVEGVHFTLPQFSYEDVGHKALAVNLSDLAAMGAKPSWFVCAIAHPEGFPQSALVKLSAGMAPLAERAGIRLVGGNFTRARELSITITAAGEVPRGRAVTRAGGRAGDVLFVTGTLGDARAGLEALRGGKRRSPLAARQLRPEPRLDTAPLIRRFATAAIDVSDGLAQDLGHLCKASGTGARLHLEALPTSRALRALIRDPRARALHAAAGGEDYELVTTVSPRRRGAFRQACERAGVPVTEIGALTREKGLALLDPHGDPVPPPSGFDHFQSGRAG